MKTYEEILKDLKIREENEELIGERLNMENLFLQLMKYEIDTCELDMEEIIVNIEEKLDVIRRLDNSGLDAKDKVIVRYNPMGGYTYQKYIEKKYETCLILTENTSYKDFAEMSKQVRKIVDIKKVNKLGVQKLAYEVKGNKRGNFVEYVWNGNVKDIDALERYLRENEHVIKFMTVLVEE